MAGEIGVGLGSASGADGFQPRSVGLRQRAEFRVLCLRRSEQAGNGIVERFALMSGAQEYPAAFAMPLRQPRIDQPGNMLRHARLALPQHLRQFAHRQLHAVDQPQNPQPRRIAQSAEDGFGEHRDISI